MNLRAQAVLLVTMLMICGCAVQSKYIDTRNILDKSLYYYEQDQREKEPRAISEEMEVNPDPAKRRPTRVPHPALVDIDSTIYIQIDKDHLSSGTDEGLLVGHSKALKERKNRIIKAIVALEEVIDARHNAVKAYNNNDIDFQKLKQSFGRVEDTFINQLFELWPETDPETVQMNIALDDAYDPPNFVKLQAFLQARIYEIEKDDRAITSELEERRMVSLRLEAFLNHGDNRDPVAIHLDGYDSLEAGKLQRRDRLGLDLSKDEQARLEEQIRRTHAVTATLERARKKNISLREALREMIPIVSPVLNDLMPEIESLVSKLNEEALKQRLNKTKDLFNEFVEEVKSQSGELAGRVKDDLENMPQDFLTFLEQESGPFVKVLFLYVDLNDLRNRWSSVTPEDQTALIMKSVGVASKLEGVLITTRELNVDDIEENLTRFLEAELRHIEADARKSLLHLLMGEEANKLRAHIEEFYQDLVTVREITQKGMEKLSLINSHIVVGMQAPESLKVPLGNVKDTFIEIDHTPRMPGDTVIVRATLYNKDQKDPNAKMIETTASFQVERFGWFAELSPAVVLVKPDKLDSTNDGFRFAPTLSWMHHYMPRPDDSSWHSSLLRGFQPAVGMHSAFLNFNQGGSGETIQIGLGTTLSFWENRLQFGAGYNLMAASDDEGKFYYFVGTDLIGILQSVGIGQ
jgi:hypothetical protein